MKNKGVLRKMNAQLDGGVEYWLNLDNEPVLGLNAHIGNRLRLEWMGGIYCIICGRSIQKTFGQGFCFQCYTTSPEAAPCIIRPELCEAHLGKGRDIYWEETHHYQEHVVYLAQTAGIKVGVTRSKNMHTRWIDQGAWRTVVMAVVPYRQLAGFVEVELKQYVSDKTDWRKMLTDVRGGEDLDTKREMLSSFLSPEYAQYLSSESVVQDFVYPVLDYPKSVKSISLESFPVIDEKLMGIRGQYLYFEDGRVINLRKYSGYEIVAEV